MEIRIEPISELGWNAAEVNSMRPTNLLFILSDQHSRDCSGSYGHPVVSTPNLDRLAEQGTRFFEGLYELPYLRAGTGIAGNGALCAPGTLLG